MKQEAIWEYYQNEAPDSFDRTRIRSLLSDQFQVEALSQPDFTFAEPKFIKWRKLNWKGKLHSSLKACLWQGWGSQSG